MRNSFWNKRIPTLLGIILIAIGLGVTTYLVKQGGLFSIRAGPTHEPKDVRISNITDTSFTVSYSTEDAVSGALNYGEDSSFGQSALDDRDQSLGKISPYNLHNITVRNLDPGKIYYFSIISSQDTYLNNSNPFEVTTGASIEDIPLEQNPMSGKLILPNGKAPGEAIIYVTAQGSQVISAMTKEDGTYLLPLNSLRTSDLTSYFKLNEGKILKILAIGENLTSNVILFSDQIDPVPAVTLSNNYDFTVNTLPKASDSARLEGFPSFSSSQESQDSTKKNPRILTPQKEQGFTDLQPEFKGTAPANETVQITINSNEEIKAQIKADANGNWKYRPPTELSPGNHTVTITTKDTSGNTKTITQSFIVYASGNQIAGANGSPTPTQTPTSTPTVTIAPTTITPIEPTLTPTPTETLSQFTPTPTTPLPPTGNATIITAGVIGLLITLIGGLLLLFSRGTISI
ncbi:MAG: Hemagglutinin/hemolysin-related protein [Candidatus Levybacteria bacterium GW2011_GWB1_35_5]|nr:MAG: Hemagglutinin/hemolysin-related protein [Candidatus Levybacteria bacterium GW2011_GWB1_35_5]